MSRSLLDPDDVANGRVADNEDDKRDKVLKRHETGCVSKLPAVIGPLLHTEPADGVDAREDGDGKCDDKSEQPDDGDGGQNLADRDPRSQWKYNCTKPVNAEANQGDRRGQSWPRGQQE